MPVWNLKDVSSVHQSVKEGLTTLDLWPFTLSTADPPTALMFCIWGLNLGDELHRYNQEKSFWVFSRQNDMYYKSHELKWQPKRPIIHFSFYHLPQINPTPLFRGSPHYDLPQYFLGESFTTVTEVIRSQSVHVNIHIHSFIFRPFHPILDHKVSRRLNGQNRSAE